MATVSYYAMPDAATQAAIKARGDSIQIIARPSSSYANVPAYSATPSGQNPFLMQGIKPSYTDLGGTKSLNSDYYATRESADMFATLIGGKVVAINPSGGTGLSFNAPPQYHIDAGGGRVLDAGLISEAFQKYGWSQFNPIWVDIGGWTPARQADFEHGLPSPPQSVVGQARVNIALTGQYETALRASTAAKIGVPSTTTVVPGRNSSPSLATSGEKASPGKTNTTVDPHSIGSEVRPGSGTLAAGSDRVWHILTFGEPPAPRDVTQIQHEPGAGANAEPAMPGASGNILSAFLQGVGYWFEHPTDAGRVYGHELQMLVGAGTDGPSRAQAAGLVLLPILIAYVVFFRRA